MGFPSILPFSKRKEGVQPDREDWGVNVDKGLFVGTGIEIVPEFGVKKEIQPVYIPWGDLSGHLVVYGTTRVGKTRLMVSMIRQCIFKGMNLLIVEPKGALGQETIAWVLEFLAEAGRLRDYRYISPMFPDISMKLNPLYGLSNEEAASLVSLLIPAKDDFYIKMGYTISFAVLIALEFLERVEDPAVVEKAIRQEFERFYSGEVNIIDEEQKIADPDLADRVTGDYFSKPLDQITPPFRSLVTFSDIAAYSTQEGLKVLLDMVQKTSSDQYPTENPTEIAKLEKLKANAILALNEQASKDQSYFGKVATSFNVTIQQLSSGDIGEVLSTVKINPLIDGFRNPDTGQVVVVQPFPMKYKEAADAFVQAFFAMFTTAFGDIGAAGRGLPRETALFIDEGGAVLYPGVEQLFNKAGGLGLRIMIFSQSFADYDAELGTEIARIVNDNTNTKIYYLMNDEVSRKQVAESFGKVYLPSANYMGSKLDMRVSTSETEKAIMTSAHVADLDRQEFLLQARIGKYLCVAPFQPDPGIWIEAPKTESEELFERFAKDFLPSVQKNRQKVYERYSDPDKEEEL